MHYNLRLSSVKLPLVRYYRQTDRHLSLLLHEYHITSLNSYFKQYNVHYLLQIKITA